MTTHSQLYTSRTDFNYITFDHPSAYFVNSSTESINWTASQLALPSESSRQPKPSFPMTPPTAKNWLCLAPELRNKIHGYVIDDLATRVTTSDWPQDEAIEIMTLDNILHSKVKVSQTVVQPALSQVCRQLRREILPIFYGKYAFRIHCMHGTWTSHIHRAANALAVWLKSIGEDNAVLLRRLEIVCKYDHDSYRDREVMDFFMEYLAKEMRYRKVGGLSSDAVVVMGWETHASRVARCLVPEHNCDAKGKCDEADPVAKRTPAIKRGFSYAAA